MRQADSKIQQARAGLQALSVTAPHDGILVLKRDWRGDTPGWATPSGTASRSAEIPISRAMEAEVFVLEADAGGLTAGKTADGRARVGPRSSPIRRAIKRVDKLAKPRMRGSPVQYFAVTLELDRTDPRGDEAGPAGAARRSMLDQRKDALVVPRQAVFDREGQEDRLPPRRGGSSRWR